MTDTGK